MPRGGERILAIGLDSVPPNLLFERFLPLLPHIRELLRRSIYGTLRSTDPPITVPAWAVMFSGMDPGTLGLYGFRHRRPGTYHDTYLPTSRTPQEPLLWDRLSRVGKRVCIIGMPPGYPPPRVNGVYVSDFLTPKGAGVFVFPAARQDEVQRASGGYEFDVSFRADDRGRIGDELARMTRKRFALARHLWAAERWDFFALHEIGPDRLHHTFWKYFDETHPRYEDRPAFREVVEAYYCLLDEEIGALLEGVPPEVRVLLLSDHGSQAMAGGFCINEWLIQKGYLVLRGRRPLPGTPIENADIDWTRTRAWGAGGYYARIFYNVRGREPEGLLAPDEVPVFEAGLRRELAEVRRPDGELLGVEVRSPRDAYREVRGDAPDLMVYFGNVAWRSAGTLGHDSLFLAENDTGPDDAVHSFDGIYSVSGPATGAGTRGPTERILDVAPTLLTLMGQPVPAQLQGRVIERFR
ncbi:MAG: alkaline phosphatase family protein [Thermoplasmata archaeon]